MRTNLVTRWMPYLLIALPVCVGFLYVYLFGVNVVWNDEWYLVNIFHEVSLGESFTPRLWDPHNEHRFVFSKAVILLVAILTRWNTVAEMYLIQVCLLITLVVLLLAFRASIGPRSLFFVPVAFMVFGLTQAFNMLWGFQLTFVLAETFGVLTLFSLCLSGCGALGRAAFPVALSSGTVAAFSAAQGLLVWPAGLVQLFVMPLGKAKKVLLMTIWSSVGLGIWIIYLIDHEEVIGSSSISYPLAHPLAATRYFLTLLGTSLVHPVWGSLAFASGLLLAGLTAVSLFLIYKSRSAGEYSFWIALLAFSLLILVVIMLGRGEAQGSPAARYANFSVLAAVSVYAILAKSMLENRSRTRSVLYGTLCAVLVLSVPLSYYKGFKEGHQREIRMQKAAYVLHNYRSQSDECLKLVRRTNLYTLKKTAPSLERRGYNVFSEPRVSPPPGLTIRCRE